MTGYFYTETTVTARKHHRCDHCRGWIAPGETYIREVGKWEGKRYAIKGHSDCRALWNEAFPTYGDPYDGMPHDLAEAIGGDESRETIEHEYNLWRGHYPHVICRLELRWQRGDVAARDRWRAAGLEPDPEDYPEIYG